MPSRVPVVLLTFDDGPGPSTPALLDVLAAADVCALFFLLGANIERDRDTAVRIAREGHLLGNHTYSHARPESITREQLLEELARTDALIAEVASEAGVASQRKGVGPLFLPPVRLPYGPLPDDPRAAVLASISRPHTHWTADFSDWLETTTPDDLARRIRDHIAEQQAAGLDAILDLHDSSKLGARRDATVEAVRMLLLSA